LQALYRQGQYREVIEAAEAAVKVAPRDQGLYPPLTESHYKLGEYDQAAAAIRRYLDMWPENTGALNRLAQYRAAAGDFDEAIRVLDRALQTNPNQPLLANNLAWLYVTGPERIRDGEKAVALAQRAVALAPKTVSYQHTLGAAYFRLGKFEKAAETLRAISMPGAATLDESLTQIFLAMTYHRLGDTNRARECLDRATRPPEGQATPSEVKEWEALRAEAATMIGG
jgi:tetratricopeptide (TPR) repeat protein